MKNKLLETNSLKLNDIIVLGQKYLLNHHIVNAKKEAPEPDEKSSAKVILKKEKKIIKM